MLTQTRVGVGSITFHRRRPIRGQHMSFVCPNPEMSIHYILGNSDYAF